ncbi:MAG: hypothetical protein ACRD11_01385 [Terriglobia bacterium]
MRKTSELGLIVALAAAGVALGLRVASGNWPLPGGAAVARAQSAQTTGAGYKILMVEAGDLMSPTAITRVTVGSKEMMLGAPLSLKQEQAEPNLIDNRRPFQASNDWLGKVTIYVKNRSDKTIAWINVFVQFPDTGTGAPGSPISTLTILLGRIPAVDIPTVRTASGKPPNFPPSMKPLNLKPGQEIVVHVADYMDRIKGLLENTIPLTMVTKLDIQVNNLYFDDGMQWGGYYAVPDPANPSNMKSLPEDYFPGNPRHYWPPGP